MRTLPDADTSFVPSSTLTTDSLIRPLISLAAAAQREARQIDETLFFETYAVTATNETKAAIRRRR